MRQLYELTRWNEADQSWLLLGLSGSLHKATIAAEHYERQHGFHQQPMTERQHVVIERLTASASS